MLNENFKGHENWGKRTTELKGGPPLSSLYILLWKPPVPYTWKKHIFLQDCKNKYVFLTLQINKTPVVGVRENIFCFKNVKKYMFINPQTKDFVPKSSGTGKIECKQMCIRRRLQYLRYRINLNARHVFI